MGPINFDHMWCHTLEFGQLTSDSIPPKKNEFPYFSSQKPPEPPQLWVNLSRSYPSHVEIFNEFIFTSLVQGKTAG